MAQVKKTYSFKSVGQLQSQFAQEQQGFLFKPPIGILTPVSFDQTGGSMFKMSVDLEDQIRDNLRNLISTNHGERLMLNDFGANLKELAYDLTSEDVISEALSRISIAVSKYMPFVELENLQVDIVRSDDGDSVLNKIKITYSVPSINIFEQCVEAVIVVTS